MELSKIYTDLNFIKGYVRTLLIDYSRNNFLFIPNHWAELINEIEGKPYDQLNNFSGEIKHFFHFLNENDFLFFVNSNDINKFPKISTEWDYPSLISNCSIIISDYISGKLGAVFFKVMELGCLHFNVRMRLFKKVCQ